MTEQQEIDRVFSEFWMSIVMNEDGSLNRERVKLELFDYYRVMGEVSRAYDDITVGKFSKPNTRAEYIIDAVNERIESSF